MNFRKLNSINSDKNTNFSDQSYLSRQSSSYEYNNYLNKNLHSSTSLFSSQNFLDCSFEIPEEDYSEENSEDKINDNRQGTIYEADLEESMYTVNSIGGYASLIYKPSHKIPKDMTTGKKSLLTFADRRISHSSPFKNK